MAKGDLSIIHTDDGQGGDAFYIVAEGADKNVAGPFKTRQEAEAKLASLQKS